MYETLREQLYPNFSGTDNAMTSFSQGLVPRKRREMFRLAEHLWFNMGRVRQGLHKMIAYHMTEADVTGDTRKRNDVWHDLLNDSMDLLNLLMGIGVDYMLYGNSMSSLIFPVRRYLICPRDNCGMTIRAERIKFSFEKGHFHSRCPKCNYEGRMKVYNSKDYNSDKINVLRWRLYDIFTEHDRTSDTTTYIWRPDKIWREDVKVNNRTVLCNAPLSMLRAASNDNYLQLNPNLVHHIKYRAPSGVLTGGWGIPPLLSALPSAYLYQLFRNFQEGTCLDFLYRIRLLTPSTGERDPETGGDMFRQLGSQGGPMIADHMMEIIKNARENPLSYHYVPFPIREGTINDDGANMLRPDIMTWMGDEILNDMSVPVEFAHGNLQFRADPQAIRITEKDWEHLPSALNSWLTWMTGVIAMARGWSPIQANLKPPSMFDDPVRKQIMLQLAAAGELSKKTAFREFDIDLDQERKNLMAERREEAEQMKEMQADEMTAYPNLAMIAGQGAGGPVGSQVTPGGMPAGGAGAGAGGVPATMGGNAPLTLQDAEQTATQMAVQLADMPPQQAESAVRQLGKEQPNLQHLVQGKLEDIRYERRRQGGMMLQQQSQQGMGGMA